MFRLRVAIWCTLRNWILATVVCSPHTSSVPSKRYRQFYGTKYIRKVHSIVPPGGTGSCWWAMAAQCPLWSAILYSGWGKCEDRSPSAWGSAFLRRFCCILGASREWGISRLPSCSQGMALPLAACLLLLHVSSYNLLKDSSLKVVVVGGGQKDLNILRNIIGKF